MKGFLRDTKFFWIVLSFLVVKSNTTSETIRDELRIRRQINSIPLVFPYGGTYKFIVGFSTPIPNRDHISASWSTNFQFQYQEFQNVSEISQYYFIKTVAREQREADLLVRRDERLIFYKTMSDMLTLKGFNGPDCVSRAICEAAQYPVEEEGLVGELLHILMTPDYGRSLLDNEDPRWVEAMLEYRDAATAGRQMFSCPHIYSECPEGQGLLELFSIVKDG